MTSIQCGYYELLKDQVFHYAGYECAAWSKDTLVPAGRYPVYAWIDNGNVREFAAKLTGTIVSDYFQGLYCGMPIGGAYDTKKNAGQPSEYTIRCYSYDVARDKSGCWHIDLALLPNVGHCILCATTTFGYDKFGVTLCSTCNGYIHKGDEIMAAIRFPRLMKVLNCDARFGRIASSTLSQAYYDRDEYHRKEVAKVVRRVRAARKAYGYPESNWFHVDEEGRVRADGRYLGRIAV